jgi:YD repeat-containing protein
MRLAHASRLRLMLVALVAVLLSMLQSASATNGVTYTYDALGRVSTVTDADGMTIKYTYDGNGNLTQQVVTTSAVAPLDPTVSVSPPSDVETVELSRASNLTSTFTATVVGGTSPYTYSWASVSGTGFTVVTPPGTTTNLLKLTSACTVESGCNYTGSYELTVTDSGGRTGTATVTVQHRYIPAIIITFPLDLEATGLAPTSPGQITSLTSTVTPTVTGGAPPFSYLWSGTGFTASGTSTSTLQVGSTCANTLGCEVTGAYQLAVTDSLQIRAATSANIQHEYYQQPLSALQLTIVPTPNLEAGTVLTASPLSLLETGTITSNNDGPVVSLNSYVTVEVLQGGTPPYQVNWPVTLPTGFFIPNGTTQYNSTAFQFQSLCDPGTAGGCDYKGVLTATVTDSSVPPQSGTISVSLEHKYSVGAATLPLTVTISPPAPAIASITETAGASLVTGINATITGGAMPYDLISWQQLSGSAFEGNLSGPTTNSNTTPPTTSSGFVASSSCVAGTVGGCENQGTFEITVVDEAGVTKSAVGSLVQQFILEQGPLTIVNPGFEAVTLPIGGTSQMSMGWVKNCGCTTFRPTSTEITTGVTDGVNVFAIATGSISQQLVATVQPNTTYTLQVDIGQRTDVASVGYVSTLMAGSTMLANDNNALTPVPGGFVTSTISYYASASDSNIGQPLVIMLGVGTGENQTEDQTEFDNVRLTATPGAVVELGALAVSNPSFESPALAAGGTSATVTSWTTNCSCVTYRPTTTQFPNGPTAGVNVLAVATGTVSQQLAATIQPDTIYTLQVDVGQRADYGSSGYVTSLAAGSTTLAADNNSLSPAPGTFLTSTVTYYASATDPNIGQPLTIVLAAGTADLQTEFDNVRVTATAGPASPFGVVRVYNPSFEAVSLIPGTKSATAPGWVMNCSCTTFDPTTTELPNGTTDGVNVLNIVTGSIAQRLNATIQPNTTYELEIDVGQRADAPFGGYVTSFMAGTATLAADNSIWTPASGGFVTSTIYYYASATDPNIGQPISIAMAIGTNAASSERIVFDNVRLTATQGNILAVPVSNPSFEAVTLNSGQSSSSIPDWVANCTECLTYHMSTSALPNGTTNGVNVAFVDGGTLSQQVGTIQANTTYTLKVDVGLIEEIPDGGYTVSLDNGSTAIVTDNNSLTPPSGGFVTSTLTYYTATGSSDTNIGGPLTIVLKANSGAFSEMVFDNVRLTATPGMTQP